MAVYIVCGLVLLAAFAGLIPMKRVGEREWVRCQRSRRARRMGVAFIGLSAAMATMTPAARQAVQAAAEMERQMAKVAAQVNRRP